MGGAPMLLMVAAVGVGYGWTPDDRGGVEFVIQIPPDKVEHFRRSGELSSRIPDEIRGSVSRVVLRVGEGPLERITPESDRRATAEGRDAEADARRLRARDEFAAVPVPSIEGSSGLARSGSPGGAAGVGSGGGVGSTGSSEAVMKPDPQQSGGFNMPAGFGDSARRAAQNLRDAASETAGEAIRQTNQQLSEGVDRARLEAAATANEMVQRGGRAIQGAINRSLAPAGNEQGRAGPGSSAAPRGSAVPPFTGRGQGGATADSGSVRGQPAIATTPPAGSGTGAGVRGGVGSSETPARVRQDGPSTAPIDRGYDRWYTPDAQASNSQPQNAATAPRRSAGSSDPAGQRPSATDPDGASNGPGAAGNAASRFGQLPASLASTASGRGAADDQWGGADARLRGYAPGAASSSGTSGPPAVWSVNAAGEPIDREGRTLTDQRDQRRPDARLSGAPADAVGRSRRGDRRDVYAEPPRSWTGLDRRGDAEIDGERAADYDNAGRYPRGDRYARSGQRAEPGGYRAEGQYANRPTARDRDTVARGESYRSGEAESPPTSDGSSVDESAPETQRDASATAQTGTVHSASDLAARPDRGDSSRNGQTQPLAAQPVFNGLLLFSFVANIYLFFWLKNLRHQFREMVAAKRMAHTGTSGTN